MKAIAAIFDLVPGWIWAIAVACLVAFGGLQQVRISAAKSEVAQAKADTAQVKIDLAQLQTKAAQQRARDEFEARAREQALQAAADKLRMQKNAEIDRLRADVRDLRYGLQHLPSRPAGQGIGSAPASAGLGQAGQICPGPILYREIGEDLIAEAERAETIRLELKRVYNLYDRAREVVGQ